MRIDIGDGVRLYVDVDGAGLEPVDGKLVERPTVILLHGGPGLDHATFRLGLTHRDRSADGGRVGGAVTAFGRGAVARSGSRVGQLRAGGTGERDVEAGVLCSSP